MLGRVLARSALRQQQGCSLVLRRSMAEESAAIKAFRAAQERGAQRAEGAMPDANPEGPMPGDTGVSKLMSPSTGGVLAIGIGAIAVIAMYKALKEQLSQHPAFVESMELLRQNDTVVGRLCEGKPGAEGLQLADWVVDGQNMDGVCNMTFNVSGSSPGVSAKVTVLALELNEDEGRKGEWEIVR